MSEDNFAYFLNPETPENLLHAETQAIAAHELDTIDAIMLQKDEFTNLLSAKDRLGQDPRNNQIANEKIDFVMNLQTRNALYFKKLKDKTELKNKQNSCSSINGGKARSAYLNG